jgi:hypothetical protein
MILCLIAFSHVMLAALLWVFFAPMMQRPYEPWHPLIALPAIGSFFVRAPRSREPGAEDTHARMLMRTTLGELTMILAVILAASPTAHVIGFGTGLLAIAYALIQALRETRERTAPPAPGE